MPHPNGALGISVTTRHDSANEKTLIVHDQDGNELGSVVVSVVPTGLRWDVWNEDDTLAGQIVSH